MWPKVKKKKKKEIKISCTQAENSKAARGKFCSDMTVPQGARRSLPSEICSHRRYLAEGQDGQNPVSPKWISVTSLCLVI